MYGVVCRPCKLGLPLGPDRLVRTCAEDLLARLVLGRAEFADEPVVRRFDLLGELFRSLGRVEDPERRCEDAAGEAGVSE